jgi:ERCC4-type nuclease
MRINGKHDSFTRQDLISLANFAGIKTAQATDMLNHTIGVISRWNELAKEVGIEKKRAEQIQKNMRTYLSS